MDGRLCLLCNKLLKVPPNELVHQNKHTHRLCELELQVEVLFKTFSALQQIVNNYEKVRKSANKVNPDVFMDEVLMLMKHTTMSLSNGLK